MDSQESSAPIGSELSAYGWDATRERDFAGHRAAGMVPVRIARVDRHGQCDAVGAAGPVRVSSARVASPADPLAAPCTGDWAALRPGPGPEGLPEVAAVLPRRTAIVRGTASGTSHGQVLAANVDTVLVAVSMADPPSPGRLERLLALAWDSGARPVVVLTKGDQAPSAAGLLAEVATVAPGVEVLVTSVVTGQGMAALTALADGTIALIGRSGAGKSSLGNALLGGEVLAIGQVRGQDGKGRHTTTWRELVPLPGGGVLIDTPGLRGIRLHDAAEGLEQVFADVEALSERCRFGDCSHVSEPGCAVLAAVAGGELTERRLASYRKLMRESEWEASRHDARLRAERAKGRRTIARHVRAMYRERERGR